jgi:aquaporin Z
MSMFAWSTLWVYVLAQLIGGIAAGAAFVALNPGDK